MINIRECAREQSASKFFGLLAMKKYKNLEIGISDDVRKVGRMFPIMKKI